MPLKQETELGFTVGVCASDQAANLPWLLRTIEGESLPSGVFLRRIVVVASGCPQTVLSSVEAMSRADSRILLLVESHRQGKAAAINQIIGHCKGEFLVLVNSDAMPASGSIRRLLEEISAQDDVGSVSAIPVLPKRDTLVQKVLELMWTSHNISSIALNHAGLSNHNCDELMAVRTSLLSELPVDVVNDGAYIGGLVYSNGYRIIFCDESEVRIDVPTRISDLLQQRRRILFGHAQVWKDLGMPPRTIESLFLTSPLLAISLVGKVMASKPSLFFVFPLAVVTEVTSAALSILDRTFSPRKHVVWKRYREANHVE